MNKLLELYGASMADCKTFDEWVAKRVRQGDGEKYRATWNEVHNVKAPKPKRKRRTKAEMEAADGEASD